ncbi:MAG: T9SS type A sorting domain-containing protein [Saprospiraceae bacterium]
MKNFFFIIFVFAQLDCASQIRFNRQYVHPDINYLSSASDLVQNPDSTYIALMLAIDDHSRNDKIRIMKLDKYGERIWEKEYKATGYDAWPARIRKINDSYFITGTYYLRDSIVPDIKSFVFKVDALGDSVWLKTYSLSSYQAILYEFLVLADDSFLLSGYTADVKKSGNNYIQQPWKSAFVKIDSVGSVIWHREYGDSNHSYVPYSSIELPDSDILIAGRSISHAKKDRNDIAMMTMRLSPNGDAQWLRSYGSVDVNEAFTRISKTKNNEYLVSGVYGAKNTSEYDGGILAKIDEGGEVIWMKVYNAVIKGFAFDGGHVELPNGDITVSGIRRFSNDVGIAQFDSSGTFKWFRPYDLDTTSSETINGITTTLDNGFAIFGHGLSSIRKNDQAWLLKLDQYGCDSEACAKSVATADSPENKVMQLIVYPNPSNGDARVRWSLDEVLSHAVLSISDARGVPIHALPISTASGEFELEGLNLANGMYVATISSRGKIECKKIIVLK